MLLAPAIASKAANFREDDPVAAVASVLNAADEELDYLEAKLAFDRLIDPTIDTSWVAAQMDRLENCVLELSGSETTEAAKLHALRRAIYESGVWNAWRGFDYDHSNIRGENVQLKLLSNYLKTRRGDCVSMPLMFLILAERLGLDVALAHAPNHIFVKHRMGDR